VRVTVVRPSAILLSDSVALGTAAPDGADTVPDSVP